MRLNDFSVRVVGGTERNGYVLMRNGKSYSLCLRNDNNERCDVVVTIDGKHVGSWRIDAKRSITIDRPVNEARKLTFVRAGTPEAEKGDVEDIPDDVLGLIEVEFRPEPKVRPLKTKGGELYFPSLPTNPNTGPAGYPYTIPWPNHPGYWQTFTTTDVPVHQAFTCTSSLDVKCSTADETKEMAAGGTALGEASRQHFSQVEGLREIDSERVTTIRLRLVEEVAEPDIKPLQTSTPVPPPVRRVS